MFVRWSSIRMWSKILNRFDRRRTVLHIQWLTPKVPDENYAQVGFSVNFYHFYFWILCTLLKQFYLHSVFINFFLQSFSFKSHSDDLDGKSYDDKMANEWTPENGFRDENLAKNLDSYPRAGVGESE